MNNKAIFLDRDGTLIDDAGYPKDPEKVKLIDDSVLALQQFRDAGYKLVIISNQSGIGRGMITPEQAKNVHNRFVEVIEKEGIQFDGIYYCPHSPDEPCECRKPKPGMILQAVNELNIDLSNSFMIGDKLSDVQTGFNAGTKSILFRDHPSNEGKDIQPDFKSNEWKPIVEFILKQHVENKN